jgi:hypothetical protein
LGLPVFDVHVILQDVPGTLALMGETLAARRISVEGGGVWTIDGEGHGHFLFSDGEAARAALEAAGIQVAGVNPVTLLRLHQDMPGQLGKLARHMAGAGVNIQVQYSDHDHQLVLVTDNPGLAQEVADAWMAGRAR